MNSSVAIYDPSANKSGIILTQAAISHIKKQIQKQLANGLRLGVKKAGCSGLKYVVDYVFELKNDEQEFDVEGQFKMFIDAESLAILKGVTLDYVLEGLNGKLKFINPNEKGSCGCGESFMV